METRSLLSIAAISDLGVLEQKISSFCGSIWLDMAKSVCCYVRYQLDG